MDGGVTVDVVVGEGLVVVELLGVVDESLLVDGNFQESVNLEFEVQDGVGCFCDNLIDVSLLGFDINIHPLKWQRKIPVETRLVHRRQRPRHELFALRFREESDDGVGVPEFDIWVVGFEVFDAAGV